MAPAKSPNKSSPSRGGGKKATAKTASSPKVTKAKYSGLTRTEVSGGVAPANKGATYLVNHFMTRNGTFGAYVQRQSEPSEPYMKPIYDYLESNPAVFEEWDVNGRAGRVDLSNHQLTLHNRRNSTYPWYQVYKVLNEGEELSEDALMTWVQNLVQNWNRIGARPQEEGGYTYKVAFAVGEDLTPPDGPLPESSYYTDADVAGIVHSMYSTMSGAELAEKDELVEGFFGEDRVEEGRIALVTN